MKENEITTIDEFDELIAEGERLCDRRNTDALGMIARTEDMAMATQNPRQLTLVNYLRAYYDCFINNNYELAISRLLTVLSELDDETYAGIGYKPLMTLGNSYQLKGDLFSAQETYLKGLRCLESKSKLSQPEEVFKASFYYNLSITLSASELSIESEEYIEKAIALYTKYDKKFQLSLCFGAYAKLFDLKGDFHAAIECMNKALDVNEEIRDPYSIAYTKANLGILWVKINEYDKSFVFLKDALDFYEKNNMTFEEAMVKFELGQAYMYTDQKDTGLDYITIAENLMLSIDNRKETRP